MIQELLETVEIDGIMDFSTTKNVLLKTPDIFKEHIFGKRIAEHGFFSPYETPLEWVKGLVDIAYAPFKLFLVSSVATALIPISLTCITGSLILLIAASLLHEENHIEPYKELMCLSLNLGACTLVIGLCSSLINFFLPVIAALSFLASAGTTIVNAVESYYDGMTKEERTEALNNCNA